MALMQWELVLFWGMGVEFRGKIILHYSREMTAEFHYRNWILGICFKLPAWSIYQWPGGCPVRDHFPGGDTNLLDGERFVGGLALEVGCGGCVEFVVAYWYCFCFLCFACYFFVFCGLVFLGERRVPWRLSSVWGHAVSFLYCIVFILYSR